MYAESTTNRSVNEYSASVTSPIMSVTAIATPGVWYFGETPPSRCGAMPSIDHASITRDA